MSERSFPARMGDVQGEDLWVSILQQIPTLNACQPVDRSRVHDDPETGEVFRGAARDGGGDDRAVV